MKFSLDTHRVALRAIAVTVVTISLTACKLDVTNPNAATEQSVLTSVAGIRALAIGMQGRLSNAMDENLYIPGVVSGELGTTSITQSTPVSYTHLRAHETGRNLVCRLLLEKKKT